jgi:hypothetical protein
MREFAAVDLAGWNYNAAGVVISVTLGPGDQRPPERVLERGLMLDLAPSCSSRTRSRSSAGLYPGCGLPLTTPPKEWHRWQRAGWRIRRFFRCRHRKHETGRHVSEQ